MTAVNRAPSLSWTGRAAAGEALAQGFQARHFVIQTLPCHFKGFSHSYDLMGSQCAGAHVPLMAAAMHLRLDTDARGAANIQRADAFWSIDFVGRERQQIDIQLVYINRDLPCRLSCINMKTDAPRPQQSANRGDIGNTAQLVIHQHQAYENGIVF